MKKAISLILSVLMILSSFSVIASVSAKETNVISSGDVYYGRTGDCQWSFDSETGILSITGNGAMENYTYDTNIPWYYYSSEIKSIYISEGVTSIGSNPFYICSNLDKIVVDCDNKNYTTINDNLYSKDGKVLVQYAIGKTCKEFLVPDKVNRIGCSAFRLCDNLESILFSNNVNEIGEYAFSFSNIKELSLPNSVTAIEDNSFFACTKLTKISSLGSIDKINNGTFDSCINLSSITIPSCVNKIHESAFYNCRSLQNINFNGTKTQWNSIVIEDFNSNLHKAKINYLVSIDTGVSGECKWEYNSDTETLIISGNGDMDNYQEYNDMPWYVYMSQIKSVVIEDGVTSVGNNSFYKCQNLKSVSISRSVKNIGNSTFARCYELSNLKISEGVKKIDICAFSNCTELKSLIIPTSLEEMGHHSFSNCTSLESVEVYGKIIGSCAFCDCTNLSSVLISENVKIIDSNAFNGCISLTSIDIPEGITEIGYGAFLDCTNLSDIELSNNVEWIHDNAFNNTNYYNNIDNWKNDSLYIGNYLIKYKGEKENYSIISGTLTVADSAFYGCEYLKNITIPSSVKKLGDNLINNCTQLENIYYEGTRRQFAKIIEGSYKNFDKYNIVCTIKQDSDTNNNCKWYFDENKKLLTISGQGVLENFSSIDSVPWYVYSSYIETIDVGEKITEIGNNSFNNCTNLKNIYLSNSVSKIGSWAFYNCNKLSDVYYMGTESQWKLIKIDITNTNLNDAKIHCNMIIINISLDKSNVTLLNGRSVTVKATVSPSNATNKKLKWTTSNSKVAVVNQSGKITAKGRGVATIKVMALDGSNKYATIKVTIKQPVTSVKLNKKSATLKVKGNAKQKTVTLKATVYPKNANNKAVSWKSSNSKIATVNSKGKVIAKKKGTCYITVTAKDGSKKYAKCKIVVK